MKPLLPLSAGLVLALVLFCAGAPATVNAAEEDAAAVVDVSRLDTPPELKRRVKVKFRKKGVAGEVVLRFVVNKYGEVQNIIIVSFNDADFVEPAVVAYEGASYRPGMRGGEPVATRLEVKVEFPEK